MSTLLVNAGDVVMSRDKRIMSARDVSTHILWPHGKLWASYEPRMLIKHTTRAFGVIEWKVYGLITHKMYPRTIMQSRLCNTDGWKYANGDKFPRDYWLIALREWVKMSHFILPLYKMGEK